MLRGKLRVHLLDPRYYLGKEEGHPTSPKRQRVNGWSTPKFTSGRFELV
jgi:hypothetical protein